MKLGPMPKPPSPAGGHSMKGRKRASPSNICSRNTTPLAISSALVTGGSRENIGGPAGKRLSMIPAARRRTDDRVALRQAPQRRVEVVLPLRHPHAAVDDPHAFRLEPARLFAETLRVDWEGDVAVGAKHPV